MDAAAGRGGRRGGTLIGMTAADQPAQSGPTGPQSELERVQHGMIQRLSQANAELTLQVMELDTRLAMAGTEVTEYRKLAEELTELQREAARGGEQSGAA